MAGEVSLQVGIEDCRISIATHGGLQVPNDSRYQFRRRRAPNIITGTPPQIFIFQRTSLLQHSAIMDNTSCTTSPSSNLRYIQYQSSEETTYLPAIRQMISKDLSEPYSIYVYRYFLYQWGDLCFMVNLQDSPKLSSYPPIILHP